MLRVVYSTYIVICLGRGAVYNTVYQICLHSCRWDVRGGGGTIVLANNESYYPGRRAAPQGTHARIPQHLCHPPPLHHSPGLHVWPTDRSICPQGDDEGLEWGGDTAVNNWITHNLG